MSTASPTGTRTEVQLAPVLDRTTDTPQGLDQSSTEYVDRDFADNGSATATYSTDVKVLIPSGSLSDTQTVRLDETHSQLSGHLLVEQRSITQTDSVLSPDGTLVLDPPATNALYLTAKRSLDIAMSSLMLLLLSPLLLLSALLIKLTDGGSVFYPHIRVGEGGNEFTCYKFRSMVVNAENMKAELAFFNSHDDHRTFKIPNDPRVTWIGRWMRRTSIDELPQLLNVLKGEMSIVGPRPPVVTEVEQYTWDDMQRLVVKPGLTCIWQVSGRSRLPFPEQLKLDVEYIENRNFALDLKLIALTIPAVLSADGAY